MEGFGSGWIVKDWYGLLSRTNLGSGFGGRSAALYGFQFDMKRNAFRNGEFDLQIECICCLIFCVCLSEIPPLKYPSVKITDSP
jgi:hypothetical protein